jgi:hypothetical protein
MPGEFERHLRESGFSGVRFADVTANVRPSARRMRRLALATWPLHRALRLLGLRGAAQEGNFAAALRQSRIFELEMARYGIFWARKPVHPGGRV